MALRSYDEIFDEDSGLMDDTPREAAPVEREKASGKKQSDPLRKVRAASKDNRGLIAAIKGIVAFIGGLIAVAVIAYVLYWGYMIAFT